MNVKKKQCLLYACGYDPGPIDGSDGPLTRAALAKVREDYGVGEDGLVGILAGTVPKKNNPDDFWSTVKYFRRNEFKCKCGKCGGFPVEPNKTLVRVEDRVRAILGRPINNSSGVRCKNHNSYVGGAANSLHMEGKAVDFCCPGYTANQILNIVRAQKEIAYAYCINDQYVHMNVRR